MFVLTISWKSLNMGHIRLKTRSPGQILGNSCLQARGNICNPIWLKPCQNVCFDNIQAKFEYGHVKSKSRSLGQILENSCLHSRGHICNPILIKLCQNVCFDNIQANFEYGLCRVKNQVTRSNVRKFLFTLQRQHLQPNFDQTLSECLF